MGHFRAHARRRFVLVTGKSGVVIDNANSCWAMWPNTKNAPSVCHTGLHCAFLQPAVCAVPGVSQHPVPTILLHATHSLDVPLKLVQQSPLNSGLSMNPKVMFAYPQYEEMSADRAFKRQICRTAISNEGARDSMFAYPQYEEMSADRAFKRQICRTAISNEVLETVHTLMQ